MTISLTNFKKNNMKPITPQEAKEREANYIPDKVIDVVNKLIERHFSGNYATFTQQEVVDAILSNNKEIIGDDIFDKGWLDFKAIFEKVGWIVEYDNPAYNENYEANYKFKIK